ncbi:MAG: hypothetical protein HZC02_05600 [Candidatus Levybacteria bacterium]|nr:hypothetical protein [Candidatus Levybacteria bacterium]
MSYLEGGITHFQKRPDQRLLPLYQKGSPYQHFEIPGYGYPLPIEPEFEDEHVSFASPEGEFSNNMNMPPQTPPIAELYK